MNKEIELIKKDESINKIIKDNNLSDDFLMNSLSLLKRVYESRKLCETCKGLDDCRQKSIGNRLSLDYDEILIEEREYCDYTIKKQEEDSIIKQYVYCDISRNLVDINMKNIEYTADQKDLYIKLGAILTKKEDKGLYIYGDLGVGKTFLCTALANSLVLQKEKVAFVKASNFFDEMRSLVGNDNLLIDKTISKLQRATYLFIDDIGSESVSQYVRDSILLRILDYRLEHNLITIFTSNLSRKELLKHYQYDQKEKSNIMKATRLLERIDKLSKDHVLSGPNLRK